MAAIEAFKGRSLSTATERITVVAAGTPALFFEFFADDYHVYGPKEGSFSLVQRIITSVGESFGRPHLKPTRVNNVTVPVRSEAWGRLTSGYSMGGGTQTSYVEAVFDLGLVWADTFGARSPHVGFATPYRIGNRSLEFLRLLTPRQLTDGDLEDIGVFLRETTGKRYLHVR